MFNYNSVTTPVARYPVPRFSQAMVDATYNQKSGVYTVSIDAAGADKTKFNIHINKSNYLVVSYPETEGFRCRSFSYCFPIGNLSVSSTEAKYVDGVLTITLNAQKPTDVTHKIELS